jgi:DNA-directed RNA polymerase subunit RPC12/RpoP
MPFIARQEAFTCEHCGHSVDPLQNGSYRNHCPRCLFSKHVDKDGPGDRASMCGALMRPISIDQDSKRGFLVIHRCEHCGKQIPNRAAPDDDLASFEQII